MKFVRKLEKLLNMAAAAIEFMESPLVIWAKTFRCANVGDDSDLLDFADFYNGVFLYDIIRIIDNRPSNWSINKIEDRIHNLHTVLLSIRSFYEDVLGQLIIMKPPDILTINQDPESDASIEELQKVLLLILGCAVQCDKKEQFIDNIKQMDLDTQHGIVECIKQVTDNPETVWSLDTCEITDIAEDQQETIFRLLVQHLRRLVRERNNYFQFSVEMTQEHIRKQQQNQTVNPAQSPVTSLPPNSEKHHLGVELADCKAKMRRMRQELEEKIELLVDYKEDMEQTKNTINRLRQENLELMQDARTAKAYRDELDIVREKASKVEKYESEISRYRDRLNELEFYRCRVEELREDNRILLETKEMLEDQLDVSRKRAESLAELQNEIIRYKQQINELTLDRDGDRERIQELLEENSQLEFDKKNSMNESALLGAELDHIRYQNTSITSNSLSEQISDKTNARYLKLELENQRLLSTIESMKEVENQENITRTLELEKENMRLSKKLEQIQEAHSKETQKNIELEHQKNELLREVEKLKQTSETTRENNHRQLKEYEQEKQQLSQTIDILRERNEKTQDAKFKDIESENKKLTENMQEINGKLFKIDFENKQLQKSLIKMKDSAERVIALEQQKYELENENLDLHKTIAAFKLTCDNYEKLEQEHAELETQYNKLSRTVENMKANCERLDKLEQENISLNVQNQKLNKTVETLRNASTRFLDVEQEKEDLEKQIQVLHKNVNSLQMERERYDQLEMDLIDLDNENQKLQRSLEITTKKLSRLEQENQELETENQKLQKTIETLKQSTRRLNDLEKENQTLEAENNKLDKENKSYEKENSRLKQFLEVKELTIDECNNRISILEKDNKRLEKSFEKTTDMNTRLRELEKENRDLLQQASMDKKTLLALREELVNEKIKSQQLNNELEKLTSELQKIGLNKDKLVAAQHDQSVDRYQALENMMQETIKKSLEIKEDRIHSLESRLEESANRNTQLKEELLMLKKQHEGLQQRIDEEVRPVSSAKEGEVPKGLEKKVNSTKEILELKDHLIRVERTNATLLEENKNLKKQATQSQELIINLQAQTSKLQARNSLIVEQNATLQSEKAKQQVENTTLTSHNMTLTSQNATLQAQNSKLESEFEQLHVTHDELQQAHQSLEVDHEALQKLHEQLTSEYEIQISEHGSLKSLHKALKQDFKDLKDKYEALLQEKKEVDRMRDNLAKERESSHANSKALNSLQTEYSKLSEQFDKLNGSNDMLKAEYKDLQAEYKNVKTEYNTLKLRHTELQGELAESKDHGTTLEVEISKLGSRCEMYGQMNTTLEEEKRSLMSQVSTLLTQYHDLLSTTLEDKDHYHEEEKQFADKLNMLRRQKEKLEEKIMEQYRRMESSPKKKGFGANFVRKVRKAGELIKVKGRKTRNREQSSSEQPPGNSDSPESSSQGSVGDLVEGMKPTDYMRNHYNYIDENRTTLHRHHLGNSSYALFNRNSMQPPSLDYEYICYNPRGSFSSDDLRHLSQDGQNGETTPVEEESMTPSVLRTSTSDKVNPDDGSTGSPLMRAGCRQGVYEPSSPLEEHAPSINSSTPDAETIRPSRSQALTQTSMILTGGDVIMRPNSNRLHLRSRYRKSDLYDSRLQEGLGSKPSGEILSDRIRNKYHSMFNLSGNANNVSGSEHMRRDSLGHRTTYTPKSTSWRNINILTEDEPNEEKSSSNGNSPTHTSNRRHPPIGNENEMKRAGATMQVVLDNSEAGTNSGGGPQSPKNQISPRSQTHRNSYPSAKSNLPPSAKQTGEKTPPSNKDSSKTNQIWYEYGCV